MAADAWRQALGGSLLLFLPSAAAAWFILSAPDLGGSVSRASSAGATSLRTIAAMPSVRRACMVSGATLGIAIGVGGLLNMTVMRVGWHLAEHEWGIVNASFFVGFSVGAPLATRLARMRDSGRTMRDALVFLRSRSRSGVSRPLDLGWLLHAVHPVLRARRLGERAFDRRGCSRGAARVGRFTVAVVTAAGTLAGLVMQFGCMSTTLIPRSTAHVRVMGCALVIIAFELVAARAAHRLDRQG